MKINSLILLIHVITACHTYDPPRTDTARQPAGMPSEIPEEWLLAHIDVETTGLIPGYHEMIDFGLVYTDLDGVVLDSIFLRIQPKYPQRMDSGAYRVNAFNPRIWQELGALNGTLAVDSLRQFHKKVVGDRPVLMIAYNSHFDAAFLDHLFRDSGGSWRELFFYYILDIPSMAWILGFRDLGGQEFMELYHIADEPHIAELHTGITGALKNVRIYQALIRHSKNLALEFEHQSE